MRAIVGGKCGSNRRRYFEVRVTELELKRRRGYVTKTQLAERFGVSPRTIERWQDPDRTKPPLPSIKVGHTRRYYLPDADRWFRRRSAAAALEPAA